MSENKVRMIKLFCPSVPSTVQLAAAEEQKLDLGSIARRFGLDPSTIKLNGHFIGRGTDLVASSVTWKSLLSFFSAKGLPTGEENNARPVVVHGKLHKLGAKRRGYEPQEDAGNINGQDINLVNSKKMRISNPGCGASEFTQFRGIRSKRKQLLEDLNLLKKLKINETTPDIRGRSNDLCNNVANTKTQFRCSHLSGQMKRVREDEAVVVAPCKKIR